MIREELQLKSELKITLRGPDGEPKQAGKPQGRSGVVERFLKALGLAKGGGKLNVRAGTAHIRAETQGNYCG